MYRFDLVGYAYGIGKPLDITWVGYNYREKPEKPIATDAENHHENKYKLTLDQYYTRDGWLVLFFGPISRYVNGFELYYQAHNYRIKNGLKLEEYKVIVTHVSGKID